MNFKTFLLSLFSVFLITGCAATEPQAQDPDQSDTIKIVTTFAPLYSFATNVAGDLAQVTNLVPTGASVHTWEPRPSDLRALAEADLFVMNGLNLEPFAQSMIDSAQNPDLAVVEASQAIPESQMMTSPENVFLEGGDDSEDTEHEHQEEGHHDEEADHHDEEADHEQGAHDAQELHEIHEDEEHGHEEENHEEDHEEDHGHGHAHGGIDAHVWLNPDLARIQIESIRDSLIQVAPEHADIFRQNTQNYLERLTALDEEIRQMLAQSNPKDFIVFHDAYTYYLEAYDLLSFRRAAIEPFPGQEPTAMYLANLLGLIEGESVGVVFTEPQFSPRLVQTLQEETGIRSFELDPMGPVSLNGYEQNLRALTQTLVGAFGGQS